MSEQSKLHAVFKSDGALAQAIQGFSERSQQLEMALAIESAIQQNKQLVAEAGTGTGKTFAYLVPALLSGGKVIISTGTKTLQDQLFNRDLPNIRDALKVPVTVSMLKGRSNYVCHYHLARANQEGRFASREDAQYLSIIQALRHARPHLPKNFDCPPIPHCHGHGTYPATQFACFLLASVADTPCHARQTLL